jgi:hypothetical protein
MRAITRGRTSLGCSSLIRPPTSGGLMRSPTTSPEHEHDGDRRGEDDEDQERDEQEKGLNSVGLCRNHQTHDA